jgi:hypothetical protein
MEEDKEGDALTLQSPSSGIAREIEILDVDGTASPSVDSLCGFEASILLQTSAISCGEPYNSPYESTTMVELHFILFVTRHSLPLLATLPIDRNSLVNDISTTRALRSLSAHTRTRV